MYPQAKKTIQARALEGIMDTALKNFLDEDERAKRVSITPQAAELLEKVRAIHGPLMFHQSGGCCDGSSLMCYPRDDFRLGQVDIYLGAADTLFYMSASQ